MNNGMSNLIRLKVSLNRKRATRMSLDNIKARIKQCFAVADNDASCDSEIFQAIKVANSLMARHNLERGDVFESEDGEINLDNMTFDRRSIYTLRDKSLVYWESQLARFIVQLVPTCKFYFERGQIKRNEHGMAVGDHVCRINFYGPRDDSQWCVELFNDISQHMLAVAILKFGKKTGMLQGNGAGYCEGFVASLLESHIEENDRLTQSNGETKALIVKADERALVIQNASMGWLREEHGVKLKTTRRKSYGCGHSRDRAFSEGREDGKNYDMPGRKAGYIA